MTELKNGHAPGHVRDTFMAAVEAFAHWHPGTKQPTVEHEIDFVPRQISLSDACGLVWNCTDVVPSHIFDLLAPDLVIGRRTYAACARAMRAAVR